MSVNIIGWHHTQFGKLEGETVESLVSAAVNLNAGFRVLGTLLIAINILL